MERTHEEIQELLGAYALDAVDDDERRAVEAHLPNCPRCAAEVADHREVAAMLAYTGAPAPEGLWTRIVESLEEPPPAMNIPVSPSERETSTAPVGELSAWRDRRQWLPMGAVAAALLLVVGVIGGVLIGDVDGDDADDGEVAVSIEDVARRALNDPASAKVELVSPQDESLRATAAVEPDGSGYLLGTSLPALDESQTYQLWGIREDAVISLGILGNAPDVVAFHLDDSVTTLAITAEVAGGVPQSSNQPVVVGEVA